MKKLLTLACCLALAAGVQADQNNKKKNQQQGKKPQQAGQVQGQGQAQGHKGNKSNKGMNNPGQMNAGNQGQGNGGGGGNGKHHKDQGQVNAGQQGGGQNMGQGGKGKHNKNMGNQGQANAQNLKHQGNHPGDKMSKHEKWETKHFDHLAKGPNEHIKSVTYEKNYHIHGCENWHGEKYVVFQNYHCDWHDHNWWVGNYAPASLVLIAGGWYYLNAGYWQPAWGYSTTEAYYPYNGPIYAYHNLPPDQVIANVQASLQAQGYYQGEVDGLLGPLTQEALSGYQNANGLAPTGSVDEPTLEALGMS